MSITTETLDNDLIDLNTPDALNDLNGRTIKLGQLLDGIKKNVGKDGKVYIPMYQRNYKWNRDLAIRLAEDLIDAFNGDEIKPKSISLFTLYVYKNEIQIVDGQQRMITLMLIFHALGMDSEFIDLKFQRDFYLSQNKRHDFISNLQNCERFDINAERFALSDKRRFYYNYNGIAECVKKVSNKHEFIKRVKENTSLLLHVTYEKPVSEFLNLNCNKTRFSICDRVRSALITYSDLNKSDLASNLEKRKVLGRALGTSNYKFGVARLIEEITELMYKEDIYNVIKLGYSPDPDVTNENRMNIMFRGMLAENIDDYTMCSTDDIKDKEELLLKLVLYRDYLRELDEDNSTTVIRGAFINYYNYNKKKFFELVDEYFDIHKNDHPKLYEILNIEHSIDKMIADYTQRKMKGSDDYFVNSYFEVLSKNDHGEKSRYSPLKAQFGSANEEKSKFFTLEKEAFEDIVQTSGKFILYRYIDKINEKKFKENRDPENQPEIELKEISYAENAANTPIEKSITVSGLLEKNIVIPAIQREYCMGSHFGKGSTQGHASEGDMLDYIISNCLQNNQKSITLSAITIFYSADGKMNIYDGQQRTITLLCILKLLGHNEKMPEVRFEYRENFNKALKIFFENGEIIPASYSLRSIDNLKRQLEKRCEAYNVDKNTLRQYILENIKLDVITLSSSLSSAEQFFIEINDGVKLEPYEIFKCKINDRCETACKDNMTFFENWISNIDNCWLDGFYRIAAPEPDNEKASEELVEMRFIEFCCRMIYWENYIKASENSGTHPLELKNFADSGSFLGDMDKLISRLSMEELDIIGKAAQKFLNSPECNELSFEIDYGTGINANKGSGVGFARFDPMRFSANACAQSIKVFLKKTRNSGFESGFDYHDIIFWAVIRGIPEEDVKQLISCWNSQKINTEAFAIGGSSSIGVWDHLCPFVPEHYPESRPYSESKKEAGELRILENNINPKYDNIMSTLCSESSAQNPGINIYGGKRFAEKRDDLLSTCSGMNLISVKKIRIDRKNKDLQKSCKILFLNGNVKCYRVDSEGNTKTTLDSSAILCINENSIEKIYSPLAGGSNQFPELPWNQGAAITFDPNTPKETFVKYISNRTSYYYTICFTL